MIITGSDVFYESVQRACNARELRASRSTKKHGRMECIFFSPSNPRRVLEAVLTLSFKGEISHILFSINQVSFSSKLQDLKNDWKVNKQTSFCRASVQF